MIKKRNITIAGAGLVGSLLAIYLAKRGYRVTLYEKRPDMRVTPVDAGRSINLALAHRGIRPLEELGLLPQIQQIVIPMKGRMLHDENGGLSFVPYGHRPHEVIYSVSRAALNQLLMTAAEATGRVEIRFNHGIDAVDFEACELLIGADGAGSSVRKAIDAYYGTSSVEEKLPHSYKELRIPPAPDGGFQMEREALHIWPRGEFMMIALPNSDGSFTVTLFAPDEGPVSFAALHDRAGFEDFFRRQFPDALALMPDAADRYLDNPAGFLGAVHCPRWFVSDKALLIGDAAHAIVPFHGQGMNCGFEDCRALNRLLDKHGDDWEAVLPAYEAERKPNAAAIAQMAQENYVEMRATVRDSRFQLRKAVGFELENRYPERFIPRYSMVMFHHLPYEQVLRRGLDNELILDRLTARIERLEEVDWNLADRLLTGGDRDGSR